LRPDAWPDFWRGWVNCKALGAIRRKTGHSLSDAGDDISSSELDGITSTSTNTASRPVKSADACGR
jgi:hypothetical protein